MAEHRLGKILSLRSAITSDSFWKYIKITLCKTFGEKLPLSTWNIGLQKCMIYFCAKHQKGVQISIQKQELRASNGQLEIYKFRPTGR